MVGDMDACRAAFVRLQSTCLALLAQNAGEADLSWQYYVMWSFIDPCLTAAFTVEIYINPLS